MQKYFWWILTLGWGYLIWQLTTTPQLVLTENTWLQIALMMSAHFIFFGLQALFLFLSARAHLVAVFSTSLYGLLIEIVQRGVPGRAGDPLDWALDTLGAFVFVMIMRKYTK